MHLLHFASVFFLILLLFLVRNNFFTSIQLNIDTNRNSISGYFNPKTKGKKYHIPKVMLEIYENNRIKTHNQSRPDVVRSLIPKHAAPMNVEFDNHLLVFDLPASDEEEEFVGAELRILTVVGVQSGVERQLKVSVYDDVTNMLDNIDEVRVYHVNNTWVSFNVTKPVVEILRKDSGVKKLKIVVSVSAFLPYFRENGNDFRLSLMPLREDFEHDYPILLLSYSSSHKKRKKRSVEEDYEEETNRIWDDDNKRKKVKRNSCRRKPLYIDFSEINFDVWIVQPRGYEAFQCQGKCFYPVADHLSPTKHAIVQALLHSVSPSKVSRSCCVPTHLDSISILYVDNNGVLTYRYAYKDMVVLECGCR